MTPGNAYIVILVTCYFHEVAYITPSWKSRRRFFAMSITETFHIRIERMKYAIAEEIYCLQKALQMASVNFIDSIEMEEVSTCVDPGNSQFYVGLEKCINYLKGLLIQNEVSVVGVQCIAGGGKTTVALALCNDHQIREYFDNNVIFITVSQSPNLEGIFGTIWKKLGGIKRGEFQNLEDAHIQLKQLILTQTKKTLVILDDVWSREDLEYLLFEGPGFKTLITTRDNSIIPATLSTQMYQLPLLCEEDALSLFCFWAFGQISIPSTANANLVKEV